MPVLTATTDDRLQLDLSGHDREHWLIGRAVGCDLCLPDPGISRCHATIFRAHGGYYILDHSFNGTHLCSGEETPSVATRVPSVSLAGGGGAVGSRETVAVIPHWCEIKPGDEKEFAAPHISHVLHRRQERLSRLPRLAGYEAHEYKRPTDLRPLLEMIYSDTDVQTVVSLGRPLRAGLRLVFVGETSYQLTFAE